MRHSRLPFLFGFAFSLTLSLGCGSDSGPAEPVADLDEITQFLDDNPDLDVDGLEEMNEEVDLAE